MGKYGDNLFRPELVRLRQWARRLPAGTTVWVDEGTMVAAGLGGFKGHGNFNGINFKRFEMLPPETAR